MPIDAKVVQQVAIEFPTGELAAELRPVHAHEHGAVPQPDEFVRQRPGIAQPQRKQRPHTDPRQHPLPIGTNVGEKQVSEDHCVEPGDPGPERRKSPAHVRFVLVIRSARWDQYLFERQPEGLGLPAEQRAANPVHADPVVLGGHRGEQRRHAIARVGEDFPQCERAVFAAAPGDEDGLCLRRYVQRAAAFVYPRLKPRLGRYRLYVRI